MFNRIIEDNLKNRLGSNKAIVLIGPRQVGKTTLINSILKDKEFLFLDGDDPEIRSILDNINTQEIKRLIKSNKIVFIDEAQRINNIGLTSKIIIDQLKDVKLIISGSSAFYLNNEINESLTGRKWEYQLLPICWEEYEEKLGYIESEQNLETRLLYGFYPEVLNNPGDEKMILKELSFSYLYKDILSFANIRKPEILEKLLKALALQMGSEVSYNELSQIVNIDKNTISKYIEILIKNYIIFKLDAFSRNHRNEIKRNKKIYFVDNGIRNSIIGDFNRLENRNDKGALWENFLISERLKQNTYKKPFSKIYFWRTKQQQEIDLIEEYNGNLSAFEFKWSDKSKVKIPKSFRESYKAEYKIINRRNFRDFVY